MKRCRRCGGFYEGDACPRHAGDPEPEPVAESEPVAEAVAEPVSEPVVGWWPSRGEWYRVRHTIGSGPFEETYESPCQVVSVKDGTATVCVYGPVVFTTSVFTMSVRFTDLLPGDA